MNGNNDVLLAAKQYEFDVESADFSQLEVREGSDGSGFCYFYHSSERRLIKDFVLRDGPHVDTLCCVKLIKKETGFSPRIRVWKRDKVRAKVGESTIEELVTADANTVVKSSVDLDDCHENFWKVIDFIRSFKGIELPDHGFHVTSGEDAALVEALEGHDKGTVLAAVKVYIGSELSERDVQMLVDRRETLVNFEKMLDDPEFFEQERIRQGLPGPEAVWQHFFEENRWIFGYGLTLVSCDAISDDRLEQMTTGADLFSGGGKRIDAVMKTRGFIHSLLFAEIKHHNTDLLMSTPYRGPDVYQVSKELSGAVSQVQKASHKAIRRLEDLHRISTPAGEFQLEISTIMPRQVVVIGNLKQLITDGNVNVEMMTSFELYRRNQQVEILTFDELLARARFIVRSQQKDPMVSVGE